MDTRAKLFGENHLCPDDDHPLRGGKPSGGEPPIFAQAIELKLPPDEFVRARFDIHPSPALKTDHRRPWDHHALLGLPGELEEGSHDPAWPEAMPSAVKPKQECLPLELHIDLWSLIHLIGSGLLFPANGRHRCAKGRPFGVFAHGQGDAGEDRRALRHTIHERLPVRRRQRRDRHAPGDLNAPRRRTCAALVAQEQCLGGLLGTLRDVASPLAQGFHPLVFCPGGGQGSFRRGQLAMEGEEWAWIEHLAVGFSLPGYLAEAQRLGFEPDALTSRRIYPHPDRAVGTAREALRCLDRPLHRALPFELRSAHKKGPHE